jgi:hypothetical protein
MHAALLLVLILGQTIALIEEIPLPTELGSCFESFSRKNDMTHIFGVGMSL